MRFGAMNSPLEPLMEEIEAISKEGFDYLELTMDAPEAHHADLGEKAESVRSALFRYGLGLVCHLPTFVSAADITPALREASVKELVASLETARDLGAEKVVLHPAHGVGLATRLPDLFSRYAMEALDAVLGRANDLGIRVALENMPPGGLSLTEPEDFDEPLSRFPGLEMTLDLGHAHVRTQGEQRSLAFIARHGHRIGHVHASDNRGREDEHLPVGAGTMMFPRVIHALVKAGYEDTMTVEVFSRDREYLTRSRDKLAEIVKRQKGA